MSLSRLREKRTICSLHRRVGAFANTPTDDGKEEKSEDEEVLELEEPDGDSGMDIVPERNHRRGKLV